MTTPLCTTRKLLPLTATQFLFSCSIGQPFAKKCLTTGGSGSAGEAEAWIKTARKKTKIDFHCR